MNLSHSEIRSLHEVVRLLEREGETEIAHYLACRFSLQIERRCYRHEGGNTFDTRPLSE